jgi:hypothetical protein
VRAHTTSDDGPSCQDDRGVDAWTTRFGDLDTHCSAKVVPLSVLIEMKEAAGRTKDELALVELYQLRAMGVERGNNNK